MKAVLGTAAGTLALDLATGEVVRAFDAAGVDCMVLKGPAMVHHLYGDAPSVRNYSDIDLAVHPHRFDDAGRLLAGLGFDALRAGIRASEADRQPAGCWHRDGDAYIRVDLHRGFHYVADEPAWWELLRAHRDVLAVEGQPVPIPDEVGCALIAALHASEASSSRKAREDLRRAIGRFDDDVWRHAADLAGSVGAADAFAAALQLHASGHALATRLGLTVSDPVVWFRATSAARGTASLGLVLSGTGWAGRLRCLRDMAFPSKVVLAGTWPLATRGRTGLAVAHVGRLGLSLTRLPRLLLAWQRSSHSLRLAAPTPPGPAAPGADGRFRARGRAAAVSGVWALRAWWRIHRRLARGPWEGTAFPVIPLGATRRPAGWGRAARLVLTGCRSTCLETALVRQALAAGGGRALDVVVGVTAPADGFRAHAWLDGDPVDPDLVELWRYPAGKLGYRPPRRAS